jgi:branched-chain amino acid transport system ATP-binding protein
MADALLIVDSVSKRFGGLLAIDKASLEVKSGRIAALIGPNGAGKTTLFSIISGFLPADEGRIIYRGADIGAEPPHKLARYGIGRTFQIVQPFAALTVRENIAIGCHLSRRNRDEALAAAGLVAESVGLAAQIDSPAATLTIAGRKRLELARALAIEPQLLLLDEVLAGLNPSEIRDMVPVIRALVPRLTILLTEHVMQAVMTLAEEVFVLAEGRVIAHGSPQQVAADQKVIEAYLGHGAARRMQTGGGHA